MQCSDSSRGTGVTNSGGDRKLSEEVMFKLDPVLPIQNVVNRLAAVSPVPSITWPQARLMESEFNFNKILRSIVSTLKFEKH